MSTENVNVTVEVTPENLQLLVQDPTPMLLDCYADWCEPCKTLTPLLKATVEGYGGRVRLGLLNVDQNPEITEQLKVTNLPTVFAVANGKIVDKFVGMKNEVELQQWIESTLSPGQSEEVEAADFEPDADSAEGMLSRGSVGLMELEAMAGVPTQEQIGAVAGIYVKLMTDFPTFRAIATAGLVRCCLKEPEGLATAQELIAAIRNDALKDADLDQHLKQSDVIQAFVKADFAADMLNIGNKTVAEAQKETETTPEDPQAWHDLAVLLFVNGDPKQAIEAGCKCLLRDKTWKEGAAKALVQRMLNALGPDHELFSWGRRRLTNYIML